MKIADDNPPGRPKSIICFITDGGRSMGMGHVQQATTLATELRKEADVFFLTKSDEIVLAAIRECGFAATALPDDEAILDCLKDRRPDAIVFDKIDVDPELARRIRAELPARLTICTNLSEASQYAHIVVLPRAADLKGDVASRFENVSFEDPATGSRHFYGPRYWVLRPEFHAYRKRGKVAPARPGRILLAFGGSDPTNLTSAVLEELLKDGTLSSIDVILGRHFGYLDTVKEILAAYQGRQPVVTLYRNVSHVAELMYQADLAITAAGMSMFEALCVGTPVLVIPQDQLQRDTYQGVMRLLEVEQIGTLRTLIQKGDFSRPEDGVIAAMHIGEGLASLTAAILARS